MNTTQQNTATDQQLSIDFSFRQHDYQKVGPPSGFTTNGEGLAQFTLLVGGTTYGPYLTAHRTSHTVWMQRSALIPNGAVALLNGQLAQLRKNLWDAWKTFPNKKAAITGEMILERAGLKVFSVAEGGALYVI